MGGYRTKTRHDTMVMKCVGNRYRQGGEELLVVNHGGEGEYSTAIPGETSLSYDINIIFLILFFVILDL